jgi:hypothetical protein
MLLIFHELETIDEISISTYYVYHISYCLRLSQNNFVLKYFLNMENFKNIKKIAKIWEHLHVLRMRAC